VTSNCNLDVQDVRASVSRTVKRARTADTADAATLTQADVVAGDLQARGLLLVPREDRLGEN
jgi:hypothetical protein